MSAPPKKRKTKQPEGQPFEDIKGSLIDQARALIPADLVARVSPARLSRDLASEATRLLVREMMAADEFAPPPTSSMLSEDLREDTEPPAFRIESLLREGQNLLIVAQYKVGKTTLTMQLLKAYCDGGEFLDYFTVKQPQRNVGVCGTTSSQHRSGGHGRSAQRFSTRTAPQSCTCAGSTSTS